MIISGIDTVQKKYKTVDVQLTSDVLQEKVRQHNGETIVPQKPSRYINKGKMPTNICETVQRTSELDRQNNERGELVRVDIASDFNERIEDNLNQHRLFLECMRIRRKGVKPVFKTIKGVEEIGNLKIRTAGRELVIYDCSDKGRAGVTRIENRILNMKKNTDDKKAIKEEIAKYIEELDGLEDYIDIVNENFAEELIKDYKISKEEGRIRGIVEYVAWADKTGYILTIDILKKFLKGVGYRSNLLNFIGGFRRIRKGALKFANKTTLQKFIKDLKKSLKLLKKSN